MKKILYLVFVLAMAVSAACFAADYGKGSESAVNVVTAGAYHKITPQEAKERMETHPAIVIVDVRSAEEYNAGHIPNAVSLPVEQIEAASDEVARILPDKQAEILVYCRSGKRSSRAAHALVQLGYTGIYDIGGLKDWPYEVVK